VNKQVRCHVVEVKKRVCSKVYKGKVYEWLKPYVVGLPSDFPEGKAYLIPVRDFEVLVTSLEKLLAMMKRVFPAEK